MERIAGGPPADDAAGEDVDDQGDVDTARPGRDVGKIGDPSSANRRMTRPEGRASATPSRPSGSPPPGSRARLPARAPAVPRAHAAPPATPAIASSCSSWTPSFQTSGPAANPVRFRATELVLTDGSTSRLLLPLRSSRDRPDRRADGGGKPAALTQNRGHRNFSPPVHGHRPHRRATRHVRVP